MQYMSPEDLDVDEEFERLLNPLTALEFAGLESDIEGDNEVIVPLIVWHDPEGRHVIVDGHNRRSIALDMGFEQVPVIVREFASRSAVRICILENQTHRRNATPEEASYYTGLLYNERKKATNDGGKGTAKATVDQNEPRLTTAEVLAAETGRSPAQIKRDGQFAAAVDQLAPDVKATVLAGKAAVPKSAIAEIAKLPPERQRQAIAAPPPAPAKVWTIEDDQQRIKAVVDKLADNWTSKEHAAAMRKFFTKLAAEM